MANTAFDHDPTITVPSSTVNNRVVTWNGTTGKVFHNAATVTINAGVVAGATSITSTQFVGGGVGLTALDADNIGSGTVPVARLGDGNESNTRFLRGDNTWQTVTSNDTTYTHTWVDSSANAILRLTAGGSGSGNDDLTIVAGSNITLTPSGDNLTIAAAAGGSITALSGNAENRIPAFGSTTTVLDGNAGLTYDATKMIVTHPSSGDAIEVKSTGSNSNAQFRITNDARSWDLQVRGDNSDSLFITDVTAGDLSGLEQRIRINTSGAVSMPAQPSFGVYASSGQNNVTGNAAAHDMLWDEQWDFGSNFNAGTETFTCPVDGRYLMLVWVEMDGINTANQADVRILNTGGQNWTNITKLTVLPSGNVNMAAPAMVIIDADENDGITIQLHVTGMGANNIDILDGNRCHWTGQLLG